MDFRRNRRFQQFTSSLRGLQRSRRRSHQSSRRYSGSHFFADERSTSGSRNFRGAHAPRRKLPGSSKSVGRGAQRGTRGRVRSPENRMTNEPESEKRLERLREEAWEKGVVPGKGVDVSGGPIPKKPGYYGQPVVKPPVWTWEVPLYFFFGGIGGMAAVIALGAVLFHHVDLARAAMWIAAIGGAVLSPILLIMDLGRPHLFLNMLRVFKHRSAMSMGAWILTLFGACVVPGLIALELHAQQIFAGSLDQLLRFAAGIFIFGSAIFGTLLATYTGVLIGATAIPAWFLHRTLLPIHFGTAGLGSAAAALELLGHRISALNFLGFYAASVETALLIWLSVDKHGVADRAIHEHSSGWLIRIGEVLNGPLAIVLRLFGQVPLAALSFLIGALVSRVGWIAVGKVSGSDPESVFAAERY